VYDRSCGALQTITEAEYTILRYSHYLLALITTLCVCWVFIDFYFCLHHWIASFALGLYANLLSSIRAGIGSEEDFVQKWESLSKQYPEIERELGDVLNEMDQLSMKWLDPNINARNARLALEYFFGSPVQLKARVL
jgi:hypothetical protein